MNSSKPKSDVPVLEVVGLKKSFGPLMVLDGIDLHVEQGEVVAIIGPSGSGKSTLVRCLHQLESIDGGSMRLDGELLGYEPHRGQVRPLTERQRAAQRQRMGMVFQQFNLFPHWTVLENVVNANVMVHGMGRKQAIERAHELLVKVGMDHKSHAHPRQLSGGQQQRVAIARALAPHPRIMLFDEPTSALDPELVDEVLTVMADMANAGITMVMVTHEMEAARQMADRVIFMEGGHIVEQGPPSQVLDHPQTERLQAFLSRFHSGAAA